MAVQSITGRVSNIALEGTEGVAALANKQLQGCAIIPDIDAEVAMGGPTFQEHDTYSQLLREWSKVEVPETAISFTDVTYLAETIVAGGVSVVADGENGKKRVFSPSTTIKTLTVDFGDSNETDRAAGVFLDTLNFTMNRAQARMSGSGRGRLLTLAATAVSTPALVALTVVDPGKWAVRLADSLAGLDSASDEAAVYEANFSISGRWGTHWPMDPANTSFKGRVLRKPTIEVGLSISNEATGRALITTQLRTNTKKYVRITVDGPTIAGTVASQYRFRIDAMGFVKAAPQRKDFEDLVVLPVQFGGAKGSDLTAYQITTITELATL